ncbi:MAG TPA: BamA/TamA family outer membrane protein [Gemmatimonadaceae bacterium]|nr:BamA/TamA family outer membrane protein [Gemmatimonadaceae bacterium]
MTRCFKAVRAVAAAILAALPALAFLPNPALAQYFGRNKVQYENFDFNVLRTGHFDVHYYPEELQASQDGSRMIERWYDRLDDAFRHQLSERKGIIFYANHPDFQQTNVTGGLIPEGTGGFTEFLRNRVVLPFTGVYADNDHVIGHELVHVFQQDIAQTARGGGGLGGLVNLPLWLVEGMAEYLSIGREYPLTAMWLRDAALTNNLPSIKQLTRDPRYFPYRYGHALWAYIGGKWGDAAISEIYRFSLREGFDNAIRRVLGITSDSLSKEWTVANRTTFLPQAQARTAPAGVGKHIIGSLDKDDPGEMHVSPVASPDGRHVAFLSSRALFSVDLYVADATTGRIIRKLGGPGSDSHFDAVSFVSSAGSWSPDGKQFAFIVYADGDNEIAILETESGDVERRINVEGVGAISMTAWSPDGRYIAFSGTKGGISDLYVYDINARTTRQLTNDRYADLHPAWSPDSKSLAFATDRGPGTSFERLTYAPLRIGLLDVASGDIRLLDLFPNTKHINPQYSPDGSDLYFIADRAGFSDIYRTALATGEIFQVTRVATGISGITDLSPALSVSQGNGRLLFTVFQNAGQHIYSLEAADARGEAVQATPEATVATSAILPPTETPERGLVAQYIRDPESGLPPVQDFPSSDYKAKISLEYIGPPSFGVGVGGPFGTEVGGSAAFYFGDVLGNRRIAAGFQANGGIKDIGGSLFYLNTARRWNWGVGAARVPYLGAFTAIGNTTVDLGNGPIPARLYQQVLERVFIDQVFATTQYPFTSTRRVEVSAEYRHLGFDREADQIIAVGNTIVDRRVVDLPSPPGIGLVQGSVAYVGDYSNYGLTSPVAGGRYRFEVSPIFGDLTFHTFLADWRRYFFLRPFTFAVRGLHFGRYGKEAEDERLSPLFLGYGSLVRGYDQGSFDISECTGSPDNATTCPEFDRLIGSRLALASAEFRIPLLGVQELSLINFNFLPVEIAPFVDVGAAWTKNQSVDVRFDRNTIDRVPVVSAGVSSRINVLGFVILEIYYARPFQRPQRSGVWGFQLQPGW